MFLVFYLLFHHIKCARRVPGTFPTIRPGIFFAVMFPNYPLLQSRFAKKERERKKKREREKEREKEREREEERE